METTAKNEYPKNTIKLLHWESDSLKQLRTLLDDVQDVFGFALHLAQTGGKHEQAKPLRDFGSVGVLEVVDDHQGDTYRAVYTVKFANAVYVLHCFQKKSSNGIATPKPDMDLIRKRLNDAEQHYKGSKK